MGALRGWRCANSVADARILEGMGVQDLRERVLRTPLAPALTLSYDPLRALRVARFAAALGYALHPELAEGMRQPGVRTGLALRTKRDRVGLEVRKALCCGVHPELFVCVVVDAGLYDVVFVGCDAELPPPTNDGAARAASQRCMALALLLREVPDAMHPDASAQASLFLAGALSHMAGLFDESGKRRVPLMQVTIVNALRLSMQLATDASSIATAALTMVGLVRQPLPYTRLQVGRCLRLCGELWVCAWLLAVASQDAALRAPLDGLCASVHAMGLVGCWRLKPLLNGHEIAELLGVGRGPLLGTLTERLLDEQLSHPAMTRDEAAAWLHAAHGHAAH